MDTAKIKSYAPKARKAFIEAITRQAALLGITEQSISPVEIKGDIALIDGKPHPAAIGKRRIGLEHQIKQQGYQQVIEKIAYSWFNRFVALRYMELHNYLDHGRRVLSHPEQDNAFQILEECTDIDMEGLDKNKVIQLKLAGDKDEELYRLLLLAQCHQLHKAMGFLFEAVDDASELLLPDNLTKTDSLIRQLVSDIPEELWQNVEIIGWLYQFYISEKKDQVIGKVVKSEDIPAATQLFTPNWIVKYLVQNSVGRQWMMTYPDSPLKAQMEYYIEPAEQTDEVQAQLKTITPASIDPQTIKVLDPACGSGHILVEAYDLLKAIYTERGYRSRDIPQLILENNLYGLDIDDRAAQLAGFALLMKARADDKRIFTRNIYFNVLALQSSQHLNPIQLWNDLNLHGQWQKQQTEEMFAEEQGELSAPENDAEYQLIADLIERFQQSKTFGSLIDVPHEKQAEFEALYGKLSELSQAGDTRQKPVALALLPVLQQALVLSQRYDAVVANPPYMGRKGMLAEIKPFLQEHYPHSIWDVYSAFIEKAIVLSNKNGRISLVAMQSWMFLPAFKDIRNELLEHGTFESLIHLGARAFDNISGEVVRTSAFILTKNSLKTFKPIFVDLRKGKSESEKKQSFKLGINRYGNLSVEDFINIPDSPLCYWVNPKVIEAFTGNKIIKSLALSESLNLTGDNDKYLKLFWEVDKNQIGQGKNWLMYAKGGKCRKWYGNFDYVVNWKEDTVDFYKKNKTARLISEKYWYMQGITWSLVTSGKPAFRLLPHDAMFDVGGASIIFDETSIPSLMCFLNSPVAEAMIRLFNETKVQLGNVTSLPMILPDIDYGYVYQKLIGIHKDDWDEYEISYDFKESPLFIEIKKGLLENSINAWKGICNKRFLLVKSLEEDVNRKIISSYGLQDVLNDEVPAELVTLNSNLAYRYGVGKENETLINLVLSDSMKELLSYSIGCMMGRYSLGREGLIYAHAANEGFAEIVAEGAYKTFPADDDGIIPLSDQEWFDDDATNRFREFVKTVWGEEQLRENLAFVAESLCLHAIKPKRGEASLETIRRYLATKFYKDHLKTYKKRPIYWLFSSGKQKAFECLVYLHRYNAGTLARMRTEYVIPLTSKLNSHVEKLEQDKESSESAAEVKKIEKELQTLHKKQAELSTFDEKLRHFADQRIELDLDDGVKVNYGKFGDLLADVKAVTGKKA